MQLMNVQITNEWASTNIAIIFLRCQQTFQILIKQK